MNHKLSDKVLERFGESDPYGDRETGYFRDCSAEKLMKIMKALTMSDK